MIRSWGIWSLNLTAGLVICKSFPHWGVNQGASGCLTCPDLAFSQTKASQNLGNSGALSFTSKTLIVTEALPTWEGLSKENTKETKGECQQCKKALVASQVFVSLAAWFFKDWIKVRGNGSTSRGCMCYLVRVWLEHKHGQRGCMSERVCGIRMRGRARLEGKQVPQNESLKGFEPLTWLRYQVLELKEVRSVWSWK